MLEKFDNFQWPMVSHPGCVEYEDCLYEDGQTLVGKNGTWEAKIQARSQNMFLTKEILK